MQEIRRLGVAARDEIILNGSIDLPSQASPT